MSSASHHSDKEAAIVTSSPGKINLRRTVALSFLGLGVIYGDIGTSPLYALNGVFPSSGDVPSEQDVVGGVSAIIWAIILVPLIKYAVIGLEFGNDAGEGGPFAVYTALYPPPEETEENRFMTSYPSHNSEENKNRFLDRPWIKNFLYALVIFGTCLTISDGLLTPAVSVTSAVVGISVASPSVSHSVVPISIAILVVLFCVQSFGTRRIGVVFAPVIFLWLGLNGISGIINIVEHPSIFRALDPSRAIMLFVRTRNFDLLAGVILAITGVEALFANLGQFSKNSIRLAFIAYVFPCLVLAYLGQGSKLISDGAEVLPNIFFRSIPGGVGRPYWWITWIVSVLSAVIASQAMITATFSLVQQLTRLYAMPTVKIVHTADDVEGQVFVPAVNFLLMVGTIGLVAGFGTDVGLSNAYGFAVAGVMLITTTIIAIAVVKLKHLPMLVAIVFFLASGFIDGLFFGSSAKKVPHGAWFPLGLAFVLETLFLLYGWAKGLERLFDATHRRSLQEVMREGGQSAPAEKSSPPQPEAESSALKVTESNLRPAIVSVPSYQSVTRSTALARLPVFAFFHNSAAINGAPHSFTAFLRCYPSLPQVIIFFNVHVTGVPHTIEEERYVCSRVRSFEGVYVATLRLGYRDEIDLSKIALPFKNLIVDMETRSGGDAASLALRISLIEEAMQHAVTHILPHYHVTASQDGRNMIVRSIRTFLIESLYRRVCVNFDDFDQYKFGKEEESGVLRMGVPAAL